MADDKESGGGLGGNSIIVFLIAAVSTVYVAWHGHSLVSNRPSEQDPGKHPIVAAQDIDARLWQDPFTAVEKDDQTLRSSKTDHDPRTLDHVFFNYTPGSPVLALAVTLPGDPYSESAETRRRLRYAILAGLHEEGYVPADEKHIGDWLTGPESAATGTPAAKTCTRKSSRTVGIKKILRCSSPVEHSSPKCDIKAAIPPSIPFEWFERGATASSDEKSSILVLWLDEDFLTATRLPIATLEKVKCLINQKASELKFVLLGPQDSTTLTTMVKEMSKTNETGNSLGPYQSDCVDPLWAIYNFAASAEEKNVLALAGISEGESVSAIFCNKRHITYYRTIASDRDLAEALKSELESRQLALDGTKILTSDSHIALISEWDTVYGELLPQTMEKVFAGTKNGSEDNAQNERIRHYSYLRGLDGLAADRKQTPPEPKSSDNDDNQQKSMDQGATPDTAVNFEGAEGQSQYDYLYRLADKLDEWDEDLRRKGKGKVDAVGVLGSDVYDKLLILQALRSRLPEAVFFTTDLDALLLPQGKSHYTRGLLVASAYSLTLGDKLQRDLPPFRSTYETSAFLATRLAVEREPPSQSGSANATAADKNPRTQANNDVRKAWDHSSPLPLLVQIGLTAARELAIGSSSADSQSGKATTDKTCEAASFSNHDTIQPPVPCFYPKFSNNEVMIGLSLIPILLSVSLFVFFPQIRGVCFHRIGPRTCNPTKDIILTILRVYVPILLIIVLLACLGWLFLGWDERAPLLTHGGRGEPMTPFDGISIWPTIALRVLGAVVSLFLIWYTARSLEMNRYEVGNEFDVWSRSPKFGERNQYIQDALRSQTGFTEKFWAFVWFPRMYSYKFKCTDDFERKRIPFEQMNVGGYSNLWYIRFIRSASYTALLIFLVFPLIIKPIFGYYDVSVRGDRVHSIYLWITTIDGWFAIFLVFLVVDATLFSCAFIMRLIQISTIWPPETMNKYRLRFSLTTNDGLSDFIDMKYLEGRTRCITHLVYFPFVALAMLLLSRNPLLYDFSMSSSVWIVYSICVVAVIGSVLAYRSAAENARRGARRHLAARIIAAKSCETTSRHAEQLEMMLDEIDKLDDGAFAPLTSQPIVKAILLPLITYGGTWLLHVYALPGN